MFLKELEKILLEIRTLYVTLILFLVYYKLALKQPYLLCNVCIPARPFVMRARTRRRLQRRSRRRLARVVSVACI